MSPGSKRDSPETRSPEIISPEVILVEDGSSPSRPRQLVVLSRRSDFVRTFRFGRKLRPADWIVVNVYKQSQSEDYQGFRCGWTCPKTVGNAVLRNRLKRWSRQWCRAKLKKLSSEGIPSPHVDLNLGFRPMPDGFYNRLKFVEFCQAMDRAWDDILLWKK